VAVTFDDGYRDVLDAARPILERYRVPATVYLVSGMVGGGVFWWDLLERMLLWPGDLPSRLELTVGREPMGFSLGASASYDTETFGRHRRWTWRSPDDPTERHRIFRHLHARLVRLDGPERRVAVDQLVRWAGIDPSALVDRAVLGADDIAARRDDPILDVGAHTVTHSSLARLDDVRQRAEVIESKQDLEGWLGRPVSTMAFPYGRAGATSIVREAGFTAACTTREMAVLPDDDPYRLPRLRVGDWSGAELARRLEEQGL
jgi:peptidoglycan/xylan/chitin deacetylase (PgdA/CDA1 family)